MSARRSSRRRRYRSEDDDMANDDQFTFEFEDESGELDLGVAPSNSGSYDAWNQQPREESRQQQNSEDFNASYGQFFMELEQKSAMAKSHWSKQRLLSKRAPSSLESEKSSDEDYLSAEDTTTGGGDDDSIGACSTRSNVFLDMAYAEHTSCFSCQDDRSINTLLRITLALFIACILIVPPVVYIFWKDAEIKAFETEFHALSLVVRDNFSVQLSRVLSEADALSVTSTSLGRDGRRTTNQKNREYVKRYGEKNEDDAKLVDGSKLASHDLSAQKNFHGIGNSGATNDDAGADHTPNLEPYHGIGNGRQLAESKENDSENDNHNDRYDAAHGDEHEHRQDHKSLWPFVTLDHFELVGASAVSLANALQVAVHPLVNEETRSLWERFTVENIDWLYEAARREEERHENAKDIHLDEPFNHGIDGGGRRGDHWDDRGDFGKHTDNDEGDRQNTTSTNTVGTNRRFLQTSSDHSDHHNHKSDDSDIDDQPDNYSNDTLTPVGVKNGIRSRIFRVNSTGNEGAVVDFSFGPWYPTWQTYPLSAKSVNHNFRSVPAQKKALDRMHRTQEAVIGEFLDLSSDDFEIQRDLFRGQLQARSSDGEANWENTISSVLFYPIFDSFEAENRTIVGAASIVVHWNAFFESLLPADSQSVIGELENTCQDPITFEVKGRSAKVLDRTNAYNSDFEHLHEHYDFHDMQKNSRLTLSDSAVPLNKEGCRYMLHMLPSVELYSKHRTDLPWIVALSSGLFFLLIAVVISIYDYVVKAASEKAKEEAQKNGEIVSSIYPEQILHRVRELTREKREAPLLKAKSCRNLRANQDIRQLQNQEDSDKPEETFEIINRAPLAVFFAYLDGFGAWSLSRDPEDIFILLEGVFQVMDKCARRRDVFKVETIGESYMAVTGLPEPQQDHALRMARFARESMDAVDNLITSKLSRQLGKGTSDLSLKIGIHSGPVTAGLMRAEKSRFQLFGDTVNTASRMATLGESGKIQLSEACAKALEKDGKENWLKKRTDKVTAKGKGLIQTYWLRHKKGMGQRTNSARTLSTSGSERFVGLSRSDVLDQVSEGDEGSFDQDSFASEGSFEREMEQNHSKRVSGNPTSSCRDQEDEKAKQKRRKLAEWLSNVLVTHLECVVEQHNMVKSNRAGKQNRRSSIQSTQSASSFGDSDDSDSNDIVESFQMPSMRLLCKEPAEEATLEVTQAVKDQLTNFILDIANKYKSANHYHDFEHAVHATLSSIKLLSSLNECRAKKPSKSKKRQDSNVDVRTIGIAKNPLSQLAVIFSALVHDVDHAGVPSNLITKSRPKLAEKYKDRSVAQQHSMDVAWKVLMQRKYHKLRSCIFGETDRVANMQRFRQFMVNFVLATDIYDRGAFGWRCQRWNKAFHEQTEPETALPDDNDAKATRDLQATVILESIMQASDLSYAMQHWTVYRKWSERLFSERIAAYETGRIHSDPAATWQKDQISFFDEIIIPLARRLRDSGVFRVSIEACFAYAVENRMLVERSGPDILDGMLARYHWRKNNTEGVLDAFYDE